MNEEEDNLSEEGLEDPYESALKKAKEAEKKRIEAQKDDLTEGKIKRKRTGEEDVEEGDGFLDPESGFRTTLAIGTEVGLNTILDLFSMDPTQISQVLGAQAINYLAQRIRGGEFSEGEMIASGLASLIPGAAQARSISGSIARTAGRGAVGGAIETGATDLIDTGEIDSKRVAQGAVIGGAFGGIFGTAAGQPGVKAFVKRFKGRIKGEQYAKFTPEEIRAMGLGQPMARKAVGQGPSFVDPDGQGQLFSPAQQARLTVNRPPGMTLAAFNALQQGGMLVDVMPISNAADISEFSRGFVSALTNPNFGIGNFVVARNAAISDFGEKYYQLTRSVARPNFLAPELDHTTPLKVTGHILFPGSTRKQIKEYIDILYDNGLYAGDDPANLRLLPGEVHQVATNWVTTNLGRHGQLFLQKMSLLNLPRTPAGNYTHGAKKQIAKLYAKEVKQLKEKVAEAYEQFDLLYDYNTPGLGGYNEKRDQFIDVLTRMDPDSPVTLQSIKDIAEGAAQGTPYIFENLSETIENLRQARSKGAQAFDTLFRLEKTGAPEAQIQAAQRAANRFMNEADDLQLMLNKMLKGTIE